jgi:putative effector of murein hydrolase LrgA (UPF0299 family)
MSVASRDRVGVLRWHVLLLCEYAATHLESLRQLHDPAANSGMLLLLLLLLLLFLLS